LHSAICSLPFFLPCSPAPATATTHAAAAAAAGIAIGITIASRYDPNSIVNRAVQGGLNGVSGGMLLYIGLNQLLAEEFSQGDLTVRPGLRFCMYLAVVLGAGAMCALGIWA
jgi:zinc transporter 1/2/3